MKKVQILMSTYNGEKYLNEQIESILDQENVEVSLLIRDDGSIDKTLEILQKIAKENKNVSYYTGENVGSARSFMDVLNHAQEADYYAFADQDDVWNSKKIISAIEKIENSANIPSLYISALEIVDKELNTIEIKKVNRDCCFEGEIVKNFATGCTMVFNKKLRDAIKMYNPNYIIMHDSWITRVCYAIGGNVVVDEKPYIKYRQHENNVVGYNDENFKKLKKQLKIILIDKISMRVNIAKELKSGYEDLLTNNAKKLVNNLINYQTSWKAKKWLLKNKKFRSGIKATDIKVILAILLGKF